LNLHDKNFCWCVPRAPQTGEAANFVLDAQNRPISSTLTNNTTYSSYGAKLKGQVEELERPYLLNDETNLVLFPIHYYLLM